MAKRVKPILNIPAVTTLEECKNGILFIGSGRELSPYSKFVFGGT